jgi:hypothetical protein
MKFTHVALAAALFVGTGFNASAQAPSPSAADIVSAFREYRAKLQAGDFEAAESAAARAMEASKARDGVGGRTGVLAYNLAVLRLARDRPVEALAPAELAVDAKTVDATAATLVLQQAQLGAQYPGAEAALSRTMFAAANRIDIRDAVFPAAYAIGRRRLAADDPKGALAAFEVAEKHAAGGVFGETMSLSQAQLGMVAALFADAEFRMSAKPTGTSVRVQAQDRRAHSLAVHVEARLAPAAHQDATASVSPVQKLYGDALAWLSLIEARAKSLIHVRLLSEAEIAAIRAQYPTLSADQPKCLVDVEFTPKPDFPKAAGREGILGAVVMRFLIDKQGNTTDRQVVVTALDFSFRSATEAVMHKWPVKTHLNAPTRCSPEQVLFARFMFCYR